MEVADDLASKAFGKSDLPPVFAAERRPAISVCMLRNGMGMHGEKFRFAEDGLCTIHNCDFLSDPFFLKAYEAGVRTGSWNDWHLRWRAYVVCWASGHASVLKGDFAECGVNKGGYGRMIIEYLGTDRFLSSYILFVGHLRRL